MNMDEFLLYTKEVKFAKLTISCKFSPLYVQQCAKKGRVLVLFCATELLDCLPCVSIRQEVVLMVAKSKVHLNKYLPF